MTFTFTNANHIGWWIGMSVESYNGEYGDYMGDPTEFFASTAFGSTTQALTINGHSYSYYTSANLLYRSDAGAVSRRKRRGGLL